MAGEGEVPATVARMLVWAGAALPGLILPALLAWKRGEGWGFSRRQMLFLALWGIPPTAFAAWVHIADPGHALGIVPVICVISGAWVARAIVNASDVSPRREAAVLGLVLGLGVAVASPHWVQVLLVPALGIASGLLIPKTAATPAAGLPQWHNGLLLLLPALCMNAFVFLQTGWGAPLPSAAGFAARSWARIGTEVNAGNARLVKLVTDTDDRTIRQAREWASEAAGNTTIIHVSSLTHWRKVAYYLPQVPVYAVTAKSPLPGSPAAIKVSLGPHTELYRQGQAPLTFAVAPGRRLVWLVHPTSSLNAELTTTFGANCYNGVCGADLPQEHGTATAAGVVIQW
jgi:hypothetical protein